VAFSAEVIETSSSFSYFQYWSNPAISSLGSWVGSWLGSSIGALLS
jgi:hypothetical protein